METHAQPNSGPSLHTQLEKIHAQYEWEMLKPETGPGMSPITPKTSQLEAYSQLQLAVAACLFFYKCYTCIFRRRGRLEIPGVRVASLCYPPSVGKNQGK